MAITYDGHFLDENRGCDVNNIILFYLLRMNELERAIQGLQNELDNLPDPSELQVSIKVPCSTLVLTPTFCPNKEKRTNISKRD